MSTVTLSKGTAHRRTTWFLRHLGEMTVAMMLGMAAYGATVGTIAAALGSSTRSVRLDRPELFALGMAFSMAVPMVAWMRRRGHSRQSSAEMTAAMVAPVVALIVCYWLNGIPAASICPIACAAMFPAMIVAMLYRLDLYTSGHLLGRST